MRESTVYDCGLIELNKIHNRAGNITIIEENKSVPFSIERIYYLYDIPGNESRGGHGHKELHQLIVAASGSFSITLNDGHIKRTFFLNNPNVGLLIVPGIWRELDDFSSGSVCLVLASHLYKESDYIRDLQEFINYKK
ncbi:FdtA/QdtA family cupin domain-containing protein [Flavobacterium sp. LHD-80]|uniref:sugar 3,4-ketoisomerase n=1 Tax=Flavobacterium sp. LHD-80 TaxID=3071411 RepID=UPI0027E1FE98|nr:FdtA/QdtA family cupin domain-containing protein [Flavobacterium sp. LHD-80]MDQ6472054.1 FdtA/QdtA family cupin domain-containing protein [Flavobacterium sp. LHD-80]